jgi:hypothetical protein
MSTVLRYQDWAYQILETLKDNKFILEEYPEDAAYEYRAFRPNSDLSIDLKIRDSGIIFTITQPSNHEYPGEHLMSAINKTSQLVRVFIAGKHLLGFSFCYPMLADINETFAQALINFIEEVDECSEWLSEQGDS